MQSKRRTDFGIPHRLALVENALLVLIQKINNSSMGRRVTIMIEDNLDKKIRQFQAKIIQKENSTYSYSRAVNDLLRKAV